MKTDDEFKAESMYTYMPVSICIHVHECTHMCACVQVWIYTYVSVCREAYILTGCFSHQDFFFILWRKSCNLFLTTFLSMADYINGFSDIDPTLQSWKEEVLLGHDVLFFNVLWIVRAHILFRIFCIDIYKKCGSVAFFLALSLLLSMSMLYSVL